MDNVSMWTRHPHIWPIGQLGVCVTSRYRQLVKSMGIFIAGVYVARQVAEASAQAGGAPTWYSTTWAEIFLQGTSA